MRIKEKNGNVKVWLSSQDTYKWAKCWPCSFLSGKSLFAEFDRHGDLVDLRINNCNGDQNCPSHEFNAIIDDLVFSKRSNNGKGYGPNLKSQGIKNCRQNI